MLHPSQRLGHDRVLNHLSVEGTNFRVVTEALTNFKTEV